MKKLTVISLIFVMWYIAGMYNSQILMVMAICAAAAIVVLALLPRIIKRKINIKIPTQNKIAYKNMEKMCSVQAVNQGKIPVNRLSVSFFMKYKTDEKKFRKKFYGSASAGKNKEPDIMSFYFTAPYCGPVNLTLKRLKVYDWLSIFSSGKRLEGSESIFVIPVDRQIKINMPLAGDYAGDPVTDVLSSKSGSDHSEIKLIREYRQGDLYRHLHFNYTARTGIPWVKEFPDENDFVFDLLLDTSCAAVQTASIMDAFYDISYSVMNALLRNNAMVRVSWYNKDKSTIDSIVLDSEDRLIDIMTSLYMTDASCTQEEIARIYEELGTNLMVINTRLEWYFMGKAVFLFTKENFEKELVSYIFEL